MTGNRKLSLAAIALIAALTATGCGNAPRSGKPDLSATVTTEPPPVAPDDVTPSDDGSEGLFALTDTATYQNGIKVTLSKFSRGVSGAYAAPENTPYTLFTLKVVNGSSTRLDMNMLVVSCQYGAEGQAGEEIFETDRGLDGPPTTHLLPGRSVSFKAACEMPKSESYLQVEVAPDFDSETSIFAGKVQ